MKLWQKIFLSTLALTVAVTSLLSLLFLLSSRSSLWERENQRALTQQQSLASLIKTGVVSQRLQSGKVRLSAEEADDAAASVLARQEADEYLVTSRLLRRGAEDWNTIAGATFDELMDAAALQGDDYADSALTYSRTFRQDGRLYLALKAPLSLEQTDYRLLCVFDVSEVEGILRRQAGTALALSATGSLAAAGALLVVVRGLLRPLNVLSRASRRIAAGSYSERIRLAGSDELADLAQDMNRMAEAVESRVTQLEQAAEDRSAFIANMAHEMKTPLTSILGFADLLYLQKDVTDKKADGVRRHHRGGDKAHALALRQADGAAQRGQPEPGVHLGAPGGRDEGGGRRHGASAGQLRPHLAARLRGRSVFDDGPGALQIPAL